MHSDASKEDLGMSNKLCILKDPLIALLSAGGIFFRGFEGCVLASPVRYYLQELSGVGSTAAVV